MLPIAAESLQATTLLIDDEEPVRQVLARILRPIGCRILDASSGEQGLRVVQRDDPPVDIVLTDFSMPGLNGLDVVEVLAEHRPGIPVAIVSAHAGAMYRVVRRGPGMIRVLEKPFKVPGVQQLARELISEARQLRLTAGDQRARAEAALGRSATLLAQSAAARERADLVSAAWAIHHARREPR